MRSPAQRVAARCWRWAAAGAGAGAARPRPSAASAGGTSSPPPPRRPQCPPPAPTRAHACARCWRARPPPFPIPPIYLQTHFSYCKRSKVTFAQHMHTTYQTEPLSLAPATIATLQRTSAYRGTTNEGSMYSSPP